MLKKKKSCHEIQIYNHNQNIIPNIICMFSMYVLTLDKYTSMTDCVALSLQELCYLCLQRERRNVPVYTRDQQEAEEKAQEKLLRHRELQRDKQRMEEERVCATVACCMSLYPE